MRIAVIPARGGSKRIPRKNIKLFAGKPMIAYAIEAAKKSGLFDHVVVSTDDSEIVKIALEWGAEVPFLRPKELADDHTPTVPVIAQAIEACKQIGWPIDLVCCIYPGVPLIQLEDLKGALIIIVSQ
jgi:pseudaminic acid cytidylyltransferase